MDYGYNLDNYRTVLTTLKEEGYRFVSYCEQVHPGKRVFLRHDIDYSPEYAEIFARINAQAGVAATFFLQLRSDMYNLLSPEVLTSVKRIASLDQYIGFHAVTNPEVTPESLDEKLRRDFELFRSIVPQTQPVFAWHNPSVLCAGGFSCIEQEFEGLVNAYGAFSGGKHPYYADSNMRWTFGEILDLARKGEPVFQLALAPVQWCPGELDMSGVLASSLMLRLREMDRALRVNHIYKERLPDGMPESSFRNIRAELDRIIGGRP